MSLRPDDYNQVPVETVAVVQAAFPKGHAYVTLRDKFGVLFRDEALRALFSGRGQPAEAPGRLALVTVLQFAEGLSDQQAADAVRSRLDWKYLLALELTDPGFEASVLSEFRSRLVAGGAEQLLFESVLKQLGEAGLFKRGGRVRTAATHVLAAVRTLHRLECVGETLRQALDVLAVAVPTWLRAQVPAEWFECYGQRFEDYRLPPERAARTALAETIGADGFRLLGWVNTHDPHGHPVVAVHFAAATCQTCPVRPACTRSTQHGRGLSLRPEAEQATLRAARARQTTPDFQKIYATRAGIEGTLSQAVRAVGLRRARYLGLAKTKLQHLLTATAINLLRVAAWLRQRPLARTRTCAFARLALTPA